MGACVGDNDICMNKVLAIVFIVISLMGIFFFLLTQLLGTAFNDTADKGFARYLIALVFIGIFVQIGIIAFVTIAAWGHGYLHNHPTLVNIVFPIIYIVVFILITVLVNKIGQDNLNRKSDVDALNAVTATYLVASTPLSGGQILAFLAHGDTTPDEAMIADWQKLLEAGLVDPSDRITVSDYYGPGASAVVPLISYLINHNPALVIPTLDKGANPNMTGPDGWTPLREVINNSYPDPQNLEIIKSLLAHHADPSLKDSDGNTPLDALLKIQKGYSKFQPQNSPDLQTAMAFTDQVIALLKNVSSSQTP
jgi:hypothetical protein